jgi:hypothetical protein
MNHGNLFANILGESAALCEDIMWLQHLSLSSPRTPQPRSHHIAIPRYIHIAAPSSSEPSIVTESSCSLEIRKRQTAHMAWQRGMAADEHA